jgi:hypothetical protein
MRFVILSEARLPDGRAKNLSSIWAQGTERFPDRPAGGLGEKPASE